jgi:FKBP-type peptidyl-prolyl cis-trans isomerase FkpA/FKBP-type peptidyl-prolyl cis-trans isomerase FklB
MKQVSRPVLAAAIALALTAAGCDKLGDKAAADKADATTEAAPGADAKAENAIPGLETKKQQVSYMVGMSIGKSLEGIKEEVDLDVVEKAMRTMVAGEKPLMDEKQAQEIGAAFQQEMQIKQIAKAAAEGKKNLEEGAAFLAENAKKAGVQTTASGLQYQVVSEGAGPKPKAEDVVRVHYKGTMLDGETFDSSYDRGEPATFPLAAVVPGWQEGLQLMPVGSKFKLWIPGKLGYGDKVPPGAPIGPNETLVFDVELLEIVKQEAK